MNKSVGTQCVKVGFLRVKYPGENIDLEKWMSKPESLYVGRVGRVFIKQADGTNQIFTYKQSKSVSYTHLTLPTILLV